MKLDEHTQALIAIGASITANCQPCLRSAVSMARDSGADEQELIEAMEVGRRVRKGAATQMDPFASGLIPTIPSEAAADSGGCGCGMTATMREGKNE